MFFLLDTDSHFTLSIGKRNISIEYGQFSLALANVNFDKMQSVVESYVSTFTQSAEIATSLGFLSPEKHPDTFRKYARYGIGANKVDSDTITAITEELHTPISTLLDNGYLNKTQREISVKLILSEIENNIRADSFNWMDETTYIPSILIYDLPVKRVCVHMMLWNQFGSILLYIVVH